MEENLRTDLIQAICDTERHHHRHPFNNEEICTYIRLRFEIRNGPYWNCVVDPRYIWGYHTPSSYANFLYRDIDIHFYKTEKP